MRSKISPFTHSFIHSLIHSGISTVMAEMIHHIYASYSKHKVAPGKWLSSQGLDLACTIEVGPYDQLCQWNVSIGDASLLGGGGKKTSMLSSSPIFLPASGSKGP